MSREYICGACGYIGKPKLGVNFISKFILKVMNFMPIGMPLLFKIAMIEPLCSKCESPSIVPLNSPQGQKAYMKIQKLAEERKEFLKENAKTS